MNGCYASMNGYNDNIYVHVGMQNGTIYKGYHAMHKITMTIYSYIIKFPKHVLFIYCFLLWEIDNARA